MGKTSSVARGQTGWLLVLVGLGVILRVILAARSPTPYGYVFDFYHEAIQRLYALGHLPASTDCWQCYHPPLHVWLGVPLYAIGKFLADGSDGLADPALRFVAILSLVCGSVSAYYAYRILRLYRFHGSELVIGTGLILTFPCLFISSYGIEADILLTAIMTAFTYYAIRFFAAPESNGHSAGNSPRDSGRPRLRHEIHRPHRADRAGGARYTWFSWLPPSGGSSSWLSQPWRRR